MKKNVILLGMLTTIPTALVSALSCSSPEATGKVLNLNQGKSPWHDLFEEEKYSSAPVTATYNGTVYDAKYEKSIFDAMRDKIKNLKGVTVQEKDIFIMSMLLYNKKLDSSLNEVMKDQTKATIVKQIFDYFYRLTKGANPSHLSTPSEDGLVKAQTILEAFAF